MKAGEFSCVSNQFTASFVSWKMVSYEKKRKRKKKDALQMEQKLAQDLARSAPPWRVWLPLQAGCSTVKV